MTQYSGSISIVSGATTAYSLLLDCTEKSYSIENNTSQVEWWVGIRSNSGYYGHTNLTERFKVVVNGTEVHNTEHVVSLNANETKWITHGTTTVTHDADGSKKIAVSASFFCDSANLSSVAPYKGSCSGNLTLTTIPRATVPSINKPSVFCGDTITISGTSASSKFSHKVYVTWQGNKKLAGTIASGTTSPSYTYTTSVDFEKAMASSTSSLITFTLETLSGSTVVGEKSINATVKVRNTTLPTIGTVSITDTNTVCASLSLHVQSQSRLKFAISASGAQNSTVTSVSTKIDGQTYSGTSFTTSTIKSSGNVSYTVTVTDSRGRSNTKSGTVSVLAYSPPSLTNVSAKRANSAYTVDEDAGTFALLHFKVGFTPLSNKNDAYFHIKYKTSGSTTWIDINKWDQKNYSLNQDYKAGNLFTSTSDTYEIAFGVKDSFMSDYSWQIVQVAPIYTLINFGKDGRSLTFFGQDGNQKDTLTVLGDIIAPNFLKKIYPVGAVYITYNNVNPQTFLGGTWVRFGEGRTLIGQGTGSDGTNSMTFNDQSSGGKYKTTHSHNTSFGWDDNYFYAASPSGKGNKDYSRTSSVANGYALTNVSIKTVTSSKVQWTEDSTQSNVQPYVTVYFWRRTA